MLYLSAIEEEDRLDLSRIQDEVRKREGRDVPVEEIREVLICLSRGDLLEYMELGGWFRKVSDPILLEFLKVWGRIEVEGEDPVYVCSETVKLYQGLRRKFSEYLGFMAEVLSGPGPLEWTEAEIPCQVYQCGRRHSTTPSLFLHSPPGASWGRRRTGNRCVCGSRRGSLDL